MKICFKKIPGLTFTVLSLALSLATIGLQRPGLAQTQCLDDIDNDGMCDVFPTPPTVYYPVIPFDSFGAIAYSPTTRQLAWSWNVASLEAAEELAIQECSASAADCKTVFWFANAYGALAQAEDGSWGAAGGDSEGEAQQEAISVCKQYANHPETCRIIFSQYSMN